MDISGNCHLYMFAVIHATNLRTQTAALRRDFGILQNHYLGGGEGGSGFKVITRVTSARLLPRRPRQFV